MKLSAVLSGYRSRMQISQREFARRCGLSNSYISFIENEFNPRTGRPIVPTIEQYQKLAAGMDMSVQQLFELLDEDSPVELHQAPVEETADLQLDDDIRVFVRDFSKLTPEQRLQGKKVFRALFSVSNPELFKGDDDQ